MKNRVNKEAIKRLFGRGNNEVFTSSKRENFLLDVNQNSILPADNDFDNRINGRRITLFIVSMLLALFLQESLFDILRLGGEKPDLCLLVLVILTACGDVKFAMAAGAASGLLVDIAFGRFLGFYALIYMYAAIAASLCVRPLIKTRPVYYVWFLFPFLLIFELLGNFLSRVLMIYAVGSGVLYEDFKETLALSIIPKTLWTFILGVIIIWPLSVMWRHAVKRHKIKNKMF